ncbi:ovochymase-1 [Platysternon megacephalum]|uniref:Ovochymase-1 n=1 Tax=Platysternon megacephalum TaxID=55544 RepID=A0A4D9E1K0_9SAUR|nr:ovochymase-1 [Platysternon megacephalum]
MGLGRFELEARHRRLRLPTGLQPLGGVSRRREPNVQTLSLPPPANAQLRTAPRLHSLCCFALKNIPGESQPHRHGRAPSPQQLGQAVGHTGDALRAEATRMMGAQAAPRSRSGSDSIPAGSSPVPCAPLPAVSRATQTPRTRKVNVSARGRQGGGVPWSAGTFLGGSTVWWGWKLHSGRDGRQPACRGDRVHFGRLRGPRRVCAIRVPPVQGCVVPPPGLARQQRKTSLIVHPSRRIIIWWLVWFLGDFSPPLWKGSREPPEGGGRARPLPTCNTEARGC